MSNLDITSSQCRSERWTWVGCARKRWAWTSRAWWRSRIARKSR